MLVIVQGSYTTYLIDPLHYGPHGGIARSVHSATIVCWSPARAVDVNQVGTVAHRVGLDQVRHVWLIEHAQSCGTGKMTWSIRNE